MTKSIRSLTFRQVNAYLVRTDVGFVLIDTGMPGNRATLERELRAAGCGPGDLRLIVVSHGDADHSGNAAYLRAKYGAKIAMHKAEAAAVEQGNMFLSRGPLPPVRRMLKPLMNLFRLRERDRFTPDLYLEDGDRLTKYGLDATILHVPGHSAGSTAMLTDERELFSGDFLENRTRPSIATVVDDTEALKVSFKRVRKLDIRIVYPGHGKSFTLDEIG
ncbi:MAG TPA: MBL fold metallo-hydrolase [Candidatus Heimdallarchaeota archaeon]|nr:MBL fold metallo-hydrolase [Candidatus Heimdallarchaeota archaeon]